MKKLCAILLALLLVPFGAFAEENKDAFSGRFGDKIDGALSALLNRSQSAARRAAELLETAAGAQSAAEAVAAVEEALQLVPDDVNTVSAAFQLLLEKDPEGEYPAALESALDTLVSLLQNDEAVLVSVLIQCVETASYYGRAEDLLGFLAQRCETSGGAGYAVAYADALSLCGDTDSALRILDPLDVSGNLDCAYARAAVYQSAREWDRALAAYEQIDALWPDMLVGLYGEYEVYKASGEFDRAVRAIDKMISAGIGDDMWLERARIRLWQQYRAEDALEELDALLKYYSDWTEAAAARVSALMMLDRCDEALEAADALKEAAPGYAELLGGLAYVNAGRWNEAKDALSALCADESYGALAQAYLALALTDGFEDWNGAYQALAEAFAGGAVDMDAYDAYLQLGHYYRKRGDLEQAALAYSMADLANGEDPGAMYFMALVELSAGRGDAAEETLQMLDDEYPGYYETLAARMIVQTTRGDSAAALETFGAIEAKFPFCAEELQMTKAVLLADTGDTDGALAAADAYLARENRTCDALADWAYVLARAGEGEKAEAALTEAVALYTAEKSPFRRRQGEIAVLVARARIALLKAEGVAECVRLLAEAKALGWNAGEATLWPEYERLSAQPGADALTDGLDFETEWAYYTEPEIPEA